MEFQARLKLKSQHIVHLKQFELILFWYFSSSVMSFWRAAQALAICLQQYVGCLLACRLPACSSLNRYRSYFRHDVFSNSAHYSLFLSFTEKHYFTEMHSINTRFASCNLLSFISKKFFLQIWCQIMKQYPLDLRKLPKFSFKKKLQDCSLKILLNQYANCYDQLKEFQIKTDCHFLT